MKEVKEIERRFLMKNVPRLKSDDEISITQYYIPDEETKTIKRLRFSENWDGDETIEYLHKIQKGHGEFVEVHEDIDMVAALNTIKKAVKVIRKVRHIFKANGLKFEVDEMQDMSLILMEVELEDINQEIQFPPEIQEQIIMEVTGIKELSNFSLAIPTETIKVIW